MRSLIAMLKAADDVAERVLFDHVLGSWRGRTLMVAALATAWLVTAHPVRHPAPAATPALASDASDTQDIKLLRRPWIDKRPKDYRDRFTVYQFTSDELTDGMFLGATVAGIPVKYVVEINGFRVKGDQIAFWFPADDSKTASGYKVTREKNGNFDLKLELSRDPRHGNRPHTYYGRTDGKLEIPGATAELKNLLK